MTNQHIVVYRAHGDLMCETQYYGPFACFDDAYEFLCALPALGANNTGQQHGVKDIHVMRSPVKPEYFVFRNAPEDKYGRYERWGWSSDKAGCGGGHASREAAENAAKKAIAEYKTAQA